MCELTRLEEEKMIPVISEAFIDHPEGLAMTDIRAALNARGYDVTKERLFTIVALFQSAGACSLHIKGGEIRFIPSELKPAFVH